MTIEEFYEQAKMQGKQDYEMITIEMGKDRKNRWVKVHPRYGINGKVVFMEVCDGVKEG